MSNKNNFRETKQRFTLRKNKRYKNLVSVGLGLFVATGIGVVTTNEAQASEVVATTENPATNNPEAQPNSTAEATESQAKEKEKAGDLKVTTDTTTIDNAVENAKNNGLNVEKTEDVNIGTATNITEAKQKEKEAETKYNEQAEEIKTEIDNHKTALENHKKEVEKVNKENAEKKAEYDKRLEEYNNKKAEYDSKKIETDTLISNLEREKGLHSSSNGLSLYGNYDESKSGSLKYYNFTLVNDENITNADSVLGNIKWNDNTEITDLTNITERNLTTSEQNLFPLAKYRLSGYAKGSSFKITNVGTTKSGKNINLKIVFENDLEYIGVEGAKEPYIMLGKYQDSSIGIDFSNSKILKLSYNFVDDNNNPIKLAMANIITDVDWGQGSRLEYSDFTHETLIPTRANLTKDSSGILYENNNRGANDDGSDIPFGSYLVSGYGDRVIYTHTANRDTQNYKTLEEKLKYDSNSHFNGILFTLFGVGTSLEQIDIPYQPTPPEQPEYKELPTTPTAPTVKYNYITYNVQPDITKEVKNTADEDVNKKLVPKMATIKWELKTETLPANREETTVFELVDNFDKGFKFNLEKSKELSSLFDITYNEATHTATYTGTSELLKLMNADLTKEFTAPVPVAIGTVENDGATYKNNFELKVNNKYTKYSNTVVVHTPGNPDDPDNPDNNLITPKKENTNEKGENIDGKTVAPNSTNYYKNYWDLDQYKGIKATKEDILKGFFKVDDFQDNAVTPDLSKIKMVDKNGEEVVGVKVEVFDSLDSATADIKATLERAKITPQGAFQLFTAENPEDFFNRYVLTGNSITITNPMPLKEGFNGKYINKAWQIDFGNGYEADLVENNVPVPTPTKNNTNEKGVNINGKTLLPGSVNYYKLLWDFSSYKDINASNEAIGKGFFRLDDYPEEALAPNLDGVRLVDTNGEVPTGVKVEVFDSLESANEEVKTMLANAKITPTGAFQIFYAENPEEFFNKYVKTGNSIEITAPMTVKEAFTGEYVNKSHQGDFGVGYETEVVVNNVPNIDPKKDVVIDVSNKDTSLDGTTIEKGTVFNYYLKGGLLPANRGEDIKQYDFIDDYDEKGDEYNGVYKVFSAVDIKLLDGTVLKAGTDLTKYTIQNVDTKDGVVNVKFDTEFLSKVDNDSEFQAEIYLQMKRIASGEFENTFINVINGVEFKSNTVKTNTPEPPAPTPEEPKVPENPTPEQPKKQLPKTSAVKTPQKEDTNTTNAVALGMLALGTLTMVRKRKVE